MALCAQAAVLGEWRGYLGALVQHLPDVLVRRVEELSQRLVLGRVELPQIECPSLTRRIRRKSMTWTTLTSLIFLLIMFLMHVWSPVSSTGVPRDRPFSFQEVSIMGIPDRNLGTATQLVSRGSVM